MKLDFIGKIFEKYPSIKFYENPPSGSRIVPCGRTDGQTDMKKLIVTFRNFAISPGKSIIVAYCTLYSDPDYFPSTWYYIL